jgi:hypothetical protein
VFIISKNSFTGVSLESIKENDLILTETYLDRSKEELAETHSIG